MRESGERIEGEIREVRREFERVSECVVELGKGKRHNKKKEEKMKKERL